MKNTQPKELSFINLIGKEEAGVIDNSYTPEEDRFIIRNCKKMGYAEIAAHLGRPSEDSISQRVRTLEQQGELKRFGAVRDGVFHPFYSEKEDETIKKLYPSLGKKVLAKKLKRPESSVRYRAEKLHIKPGPPTHLNPPRVAQLLGVCQRIVLDWIYQGFLKADNQFGRRVGRHREWIINPRDFYDFIKKYYYLYDPGRVEDRFLKEVIGSTPAGKVMTVSQAAKVLGIVESAVIKRAINGKFPVAYKGFGPSGHTRWYVQCQQVGKSINESKKRPSQTRYQIGGLVISHNFLDPGICGKTGKVVVANREEVKVDFGEGMIRIYKKGSSLHHIAPCTDKQKP